MGKNKLSDMQRAFVDHYIQCWKATEAARRAGYSAKTANVAASKLLKNPRVQAAIKEIQDQTRSESIMEYEEACKILSSIARGKAGDYFDDYDRVNIHHLKLKNAHAVASIKQQMGDGYPVLQFRLHDKIQALERLAKLRGWDAPERHEVNYTVTPPEDEDDTEE